MLAAYLRLQGHQVRTAAEAAEALQIAAELLPEVILLDVCMRRWTAMNFALACARCRHSPEL
jgi:CheY-like chemotaxis protein